MRFVPDQIEALIALGRLEEAEALLDCPRAPGGAASTVPPRWPRQAAVAASSPPRAATSTARSHRWRTRSASTSACRCPSSEARTLLALGATRRRARMKRPAREALEQALAIFDAARRSALGREDARRARPHRRTPRRDRRADRDRTPNRGARRRGTLEQGDRGGPVRDTEDGRNPALADLPQGRRALPHRARQAPVQRRRDAQSVGIRRLSETPRPP